MSYNNYPKTDWSNSKTDNSQNTKPCENGEKVILNEETNKYSFNKFISFFDPLDREWADKIIKNGGQVASKSIPYTSFELKYLSKFTSYYICPNLVNIYYDINEPIPFFDTSYPPNPDNLSVWEQDENFKKIITVIERYKKIEGIGNSSNNLKRGTGDYAKQFRNNLRAGQYGFKPSSAAGASGIIIIIIQIYTHFKKKEIIDEWRLLYDKIQAKYDKMKSIYLSYLESIEVSKSMYNTIWMFKDYIEGKTGKNLDYKSLADLSNIILAEMGLDYWSRSGNLFSVQNIKNIKFPYQYNLNFPKKSNYSFSELYNMLNVSFE